MKHIEGKITIDTKLLGRKELLLDNIKGKTLDIGCGEGELLIKATLFGHDIIGVDRSQDELNIANETAELSGVQIRTICADVNKLPFEPETFDTIIMGEIIEHLENPIETLKYVITFLKKGGQLLITTPAGFAHSDADHKNFFFAREVIERLNKYWILDYLPSMMFKIFKFIPIDDFFKELNMETLIEEKEYGDSNHPSLDFFIKVIK
jgi:2-polyprenyl-6-hydroxyphenyl methylase/3-demethylubiquinone-9 3-methyltransferase